MDGGRTCTGQQAVKGPVPGGTPPEHAQQEGGKQGCVNKGEDELQHFHDVVEPQGDVTSPNRGQCSDKSGCMSHQQVMPLALVGIQVGPINVERPHVVDGGGVPGHARHEARQEGRKPKPQDTHRQVVQQHHGHCQVEIRLGFRILQNQLPIILYLFLCQGFALFQGLQELFLIRKLPVYPGV